MKSVREIVRSVIDSEKCMGDSKAHQGDSEDC